MSAWSGKIPVLRTMATILTAALLALPLFAHDGADVGPRGLLLAWSWEPLILLPLVASALLYARGALKLRHSSSPKSLPRWQILSFTGGWLALVVGLISPLHALGAALFSAHMTQHELLMLVAAPLLVMSRPLVVFVWALPPTWRVRVAALAKMQWVSVPWRFISFPLVVWLVHGATFWIWHIPLFYQATLNSDLVHGLQHATFLGTALLFWFTLIQGRYGQKGYGVAVLYVFTTAVHTSALGALLTLAQNVWYPIYEGRTAAWHLTPFEDQQLGGLIMWIPCGVVFIVIGLALLAAWLGESERRQGYSQTAALMRASTGEDG